MRDEYKNEAHFLKSVEIYFFVRNLTISIRKCSIPIPLDVNLFPSHLFRGAPFAYKRGSVVAISIEHKLRTVNCHFWKQIQ